jgi:ribonuclease G
MKREILISATQREVRVAILEDEQLVELQVDRPENKRMVGDIYLGKVEAVLPGIQAAFVNIGTEKSAFLHNADLVYDEGDDDDDVDEEDADDAADESEEAGDAAADSVADTVAEAPSSPAAAAAVAPQVAVAPADSPYADVPAPERSGNAPGKVQRRPKQGRRGGGGGGGRRRKEPPQIQDVLKRGQSIIVQVSKEPISTKGPRVTAQVSLAGRFLVYMPFASNRVGVSRKIGERAQRQRLREQVKKFLPKDAGGVIVRTVGEDVTPETFERELKTLITQWERTNKKTKFVGNPPKLLHRETSLTRGIIRDLFSTKVDRLTVDSKQVYNEILEYLKGIAPELIDRVQRYEEKVSLFDKEGIEKELKDLFKRRCDLPSGGYLIIEPTEALVSIDVNSGRYTGKKDPEKTVTKTNVEAAREIARQLRLRDVGGIIVCDFIDMETKANRDRVLNELRTHLGRDRARTKAFAVSDLGLVEMTRQRVRQSHFHAMTEACPICEGTGRVFTAETIVRRMERSVKRLASEGRREGIIVKLYPDTAMYVLEEEKDLIRRLEKSVGFTVEMRDDPLLKPDEFKLVVKGAGRDITSQYAVA